MKKILVINNYDSFVYNLTAILSKLNSIKYDIVYNDKIPFRLLNQYQAVIISPGPKIPKQSGDILKLLSEIHNTHYILGVCLGHQAIAEFFGAKLIRYSYPLHGRQIEITKIDENSILFKNIKYPINVGLYSSWVISNISFPKDLIVTSYDDYNNIMSLEHKFLPIFGVQFHPESYMSNCGELIIKNFIDLF